MEPHSSRIQVKDMRSVQRTFSSSITSGMNGGSKKHNIVHGGKTVRDHVRVGAVVTNIGICSGVERTIVGKSTEICAGFTKTDHIT